MTIECPYCDYEMADPEECYEEDAPYQHECRSCRKQFAFTLSYSRNYHPRKAECLNGGEHVDTKCGSYPRYTVMRCTMCGRTRAQKD